VVAAGLADADTRLAVLAAGLPLPAEVLAYHALHDPAAAVRDEALLLLRASGAAVPGPAGAALDAEDPATRLLAQELLDRR
jgi:hypothetical protein